MSYKLYKLIIKDNSTIDRQLDSMDCGPACLKMITKYYGEYYSLQIFRDKCGITKEGVSFDDISYAAESIGLQSLSMKCTVKDILFKIPLPAIIHWDNSHFVVVYKVKDRSQSIVGEKSEQDISSKIYIADPAKGKINYNLKEFADKWVKYGTDKGMLMALEPQADFYERQEEERIERLKTL